MDDRESPFDPSRALNEVSHGVAEATKREILVQLACSIQTLVKPQQSKPNSGHATC